MGQVFRSGLARGLAWGLLWGLQVKMWLGLQSAKPSEGLTEPGGSASKVAHAGHGGWQEASFLLHLGLPLGCVSVFRVWWLASTRTGDPKEQDRSHSAIFDFLRSHSLSFLTHSICYKQITKSSPHSRGWRLGSTFDVSFVENLADIF